MASLHLQHVTFKGEELKGNVREQPPLGQSDIVVLLVRKHSQKGMAFLVI